MHSNTTPSLRHLTPEQPPANGHFATEGTCDKFTKAGRASGDTYPTRPALEAPHTAVHVLASAAICRERWRTPMSARLDASHTQTATSTPSPVGPEHLEGPGPDGADGLTGLDGLPEIP